jgi:hypothetical protein
VNAGSPHDAPFGVKATGSPPSVTRYSADGTCSRIIPSRFAAAAKTISRPSGAHTGWSVRVAPSPVNTPSNPRSAASRVPASQSTAGRPSISCTSTCGFAPSSHVFQ